MTTATSPPVERRAGGRRSSSRVVRRRARRRPGRHRAVRSLSAPGAARMSSSGSAADGRQAPLAERALGGGPGQRHVGRPDRRARSGRELAQVVAATVPASPRATGPVRAASPRRRALSSAARSSGPRTRRGSATPAARSSSIACGDQGDQVVGAVGEGRVVERPVVLGDPHRLAAHLDDQRLGDRPQRLVGAVTPKQQSASRSRSIAVPVNVIAGCSASGEHVLRRAPARARRRRALPEVCTTSWPACQAPVAASPATRCGERVVGHGEQQQLGPRDDRPRPCGRGTPGSRSRRASGTASLTRRTTATTRWPARCRAAPSTAPTRPAPTTPTRRRAGRSSGVLTAETLSRWPGHVACCPCSETPWADAWHDALYGPTGFYRQDRGPAGHFTTATQAAPCWAPVAGGGAGPADGRARACTTLVDVGCGRGELLTDGRTGSPRRCAASAWTSSPGRDLPAGRGLAPLPRRRALPPELSDLTHAARRARVARRRARAPWPQVDERRAAARGARRPGDRAGAPRRRAVRRGRWRGAHALAGRRPGARPATASRSAAAATRRGRDLVSRLRSGLALAVDYGHTRGDRPGGRHADGLPRGPSGGPGARRVVRPHRPRRDGLPGRTTSSSTSAPRCGGSASAGRRPPHELATSDPAAYLAALATASAAAALTARGEPRATSAGPSRPSAAGLTVRNGRRPRGHGLVPVRAGRDWVAGNRKDPS